MSRVLLEHRIMDRSITFRSSRMFPGQSYVTSASILACATESIVFPSIVEYLETKNDTSNGISSRRSRSGGLSIGKTLRR